MNGHEESPTGHESVARTAGVYSDLHPGLTLSGFLRARIAEREADPWWPDLGIAYEDRAVGAEEQAALAAERARWEAFVLAECESKRQILDLHESWPVLVQQPPTYDTVSKGDPTAVVFRASQQIAWTTTKAYRDHFGDEPPTTPILRAMVLPYVDHPDCREEWKP